MGDPEHPNSFRFDAFNDGEPDLSALELDSLAKELFVQMDNEEAGNAGR